MDSKVGFACGSLAWNCWHERPFLSCLEVSLDSIKVSICIESRGIESRRRKEKSGLQNVAAYAAYSHALNCAKGDSQGEVTSYAMMHALVVNAAETVLLWLCYVTLLEQGFVEYWDGVRVAW